MISMISRIVRQSFLTFLWNYRCMEISSPLRGNSGFSVAATSSPRFGSFVNPRAALSPHRHLHQKQEKSLPTYLCLHQDLIPLSSSSSTAFNRLVSDIFTRPHNVTSLTFNNVMLVGSMLVGQIQIITQLGCL